MDDGLESDSMASGRSVIGCILLIFLGFMWAPIWILTKASENSANVHDLFAVDEAVSLSKHFLTNVANCIDDNEHYFGFSQSDFHNLYIIGKVSKN